MADPIPTKTKTLADIAVANAAANTGSSKWTSEKFSTAQHADAASDIVALADQKTTYVIDTIKRLLKTDSINVKTSEADLNKALTSAKDVLYAVKNGSSPKVESVDSNTTQSTNTSAVENTVDEVESPRVK